MHIAESAQPREQFVQLREKRFHYLEWGDARNPPLVLAHGGASSARGTWLTTAPAFADRFHILAIDHRGHGETEWDAEARYTLEEYAADLRAFVVELGIPPFFVIAHSMGGLIAMAYACAYANTIRGLVLVDAGLRFGIPPDTRPRSPLSSRPLKFASREEAEAYARSMFPEAVRDRSVSYGFIELPDGGVTWRTDVVGLSKSAQTGDDAIDRVRAAFASAPFPILLLRAGASGGITLEAVDKMKATNPRLQVTTYERAHHWLHQDEPEKFERDVSAFLIRAGGPAPSVRH